ncbi:MAG: hypothetical protein KDK97_00355 [Verrucomicrobiales bacterium]|nr:hypothetical protein [Verrucomicrobiales bacterium]MCP5556807.1 hypothetical protein [Verrucomicrobiaceae bacterium]
MNIQKVFRWSCHSILMSSWLLIPNTAFPDEVLLEGTQPIEFIQDQEFLESLTPELLSQKSDGEVAPIYVTRICGGWHNSKWAEFVDADIMRRQGSSRILLHLLHYPVNRGVPASLWQWLSKHPGHQVTSQIIDESLATVRSGEVFSESRLVDQSKSRRVLRYGDVVINLSGVEELAFLMVAVMDPRCEGVFEELDKMGVALDVARSRYTSQLKRQHASTLANPSPSLQDPTQPILSTAPALSAPREEIASSMPWSIIGVVIAVVTGLVWLLRKGRN